MKDQQRADHAIINKAIQTTRMGNIMVLLCAFFLFSIRAFGAFLSPIADCDETFNYWEPLHFLLFGFGMQTWEYSPEHCLRSYAFLTLYKSFSILAMFLHPYFLHINKLPIPGIRSPKVFAFYFVRCMQAFFSAAAEIKLVEATRAFFGGSAAAFLFLFLITSPGLFRSAVEFLPSSFAMICLCFALSAWIRHKHFAAVLLVALAALLGWIYVAILAVPMALHMMLQRNGLLNFFRNACVCGLLILAYMIPIDSLLYGKLAIPPMNHVWYNVFPEEGTGSHIFGVESWKFYFVNLFLNCNVAAFFLLCFPLLLLIGSFTYLYDALGVELWRRIIYLSPTYVALAVFLPQPHKEERFLAPCYPFIALVAAVAASDCLRFVTKLCRNGTLSTLVKSVVSVVVLVLTCAAGVSRIYMQASSFLGPLVVYGELSENELSKLSNRTLNENKEINICVGKEWYRFPSSFFLPDRRFRLRFIRSSFTGLLPKPFAEHENGTMVIPRGMNPYNREDPEQYFDWQEYGGCHYFVDLDLSHRNGANGADESNPIRKDARELLYFVPFLDSDASPPGYRAFAIPNSKSKLVYGEYQVIRNLDLLPHEV